MTNFNMANKISFMKCAPKTVPGDADIGPEGPDQKSTAATLISMKN